MASARRQNLSEQVAARIKQLILDEALKPGDRLPTELEMAEQFGVSRVSVREATKALSFLGIIHAAPRRGLTIGQVDMRRLTEYLGFHLAVGDYPKRELLQTRLVIETGSLPYIAQAMAADSAIFVRLEACILAGTTATTNAERVASDVAFHRTLLEVSAIGPLLAFDSLLQIFFSRFGGSLGGEHWQQANRHHTQVIHLLRNGDVDEARKVLTDHLGGYFERVSD
jgi:GntR family transcriptional regulator, transcriptional repressor for pyruvate dehydrogenase complex